MKNLSQSNRILAIAGVVVILLGVIASVIGGSSVTEFDVATPEGVVQRYIDSVLEGDDAAADDFLTSTLRTECGDEASFVFRIHEENGIRVALDESTIDGAEARVQVRVTEGTAGLFDSFEYTHGEWFELEQVDGVWKINYQSWPRYGC